MATFNATNAADPSNPNVTGQGVVKPYAAKSITVTNTAGSPQDPVSMTLGISSTADMLVSVDSGTGVAGPTGQGTLANPFVMNVQNLTVFAKNWRMYLEYTTPNPDSTPSSVSFYVA